MIDLAASFTPWGAFGVSVQATYDWVNPFNTQIPWDKKGEWNWAMGEYHHQLTNLLQDLYRQSCSSGDKLKQQAQEQYADIAHDL